MLTPSFLYQIFAGHTPIFTISCVLPISTANTCEKLDNVIISNKIVHTTFLVFSFIFHFLPSKKEELITNPSFNFKLLFYAYIIFCNTIYIYCIYHESTRKYICNFCFNLTFSKWIKTVVLHCIF